MDTALGAGGAAPEFNVFAMDSRVKIRCDAFVRILNLQGEECNILTVGGLKWQAEQRFW